MKRLWTIPMLAALAFAAVVPLSASECSYNVQTCLEYLSKMRDRGYAGIDLDTRGDDGKMTVTKVYSDTPAAAARVRIGDVLLSIGGIRLGDEAAMQGLDGVMRPGNTVEFTFLREGKNKVLELTLVRMPDDVYARFVGEHMLDHVTVEVADAD